MFNLGFEFLKNTKKLKIFKSQLKHILTPEKSAFRPDKNNMLILINTMLEKYLFMLKEAQSKPARSMEGDNVKVPAV